MAFSNVKKIVNETAASPAEFRESMRLLSGGVSVLTVGRGDNITGMTVTSVSALSLDPPSLIVSINRQASSWPLLQREGSFGVNFLSAEQQVVAERFAGKGGLKGAERFAGTPWITLQTGAPILSEALAGLDCEIEEIIERHSHGIVIGRILSIHRSRMIDGLSYWQGTYYALHDSLRAISEPK
jgi:flavin reductase (DIM6/NTAB) family NADH-FMN oxidoreductase RutF